jgi:uncharacterized protein HemY
LSEPADKTDLEQAKQAILDRIDALGTQTSAEHGAIVNNSVEQNRATRAHIGNEVATMRGDVSHTKNYMERILKAMKRFLSRHGIGSDDL